MPTNVITNVKLGGSIEVPMIDTTNSSYMSGSVYYGPDTESFSVSSTSGFGVRSRNNFVELMFPITRNPAEFAKFYARALNHENRKLGNKPIPAALRDQQNCIVAGDGIPNLHSSFNLDLQLTRVDRHGYKSAWSGESITSQLTNLGHGPLRRYPVLRLCISYNNPTEQLNRRIAKCLDVQVALPWREHCLRSHYLTAGCFEVSSMSEPGVYKTKPYGLEYLCSTRMLSFIPAFTAWHMWYAAIFGGLQYADDLDDFGPDIEALLRGNPGAMGIANPHSKVLILMQGLGASKVSEWRAPA